MMGQQMAATHSQSAGNNKTKKFKSFTTHEREDRLQEIQASSTPVTP